MDNGDTFCTDCMSEICKIFDLYLDSAEYFKHPQVLDQVPVQDIKPEIKEKCLSIEEENNIRCIIEKDLKEFNEHCECPEPQKTQFTLQELGMEIEKAVNEVKTVMEEEYLTRANVQLESLSEKFELVLRNEQARTTLRFHEAQRQYSEKIGALRHHLECKNMTTLMYVLANERRTCKLEAAKLIGDFNDREAELLQDIEKRDQLLVAMMKEHRLVTMVNAEWQDKMTKLLCAFHKFIAYAFDRTPDSIQYILDVPALLDCESIKEPVQDEEKIEEVPEKETASVECERLTKICSKCEAECGCKQLEESPSDTWWKMLEAGGKPFIVYGDLSGMPPPQRRQVLQTLPDRDEAKMDTYVFNDRILKADCDNVAVAKEYYNTHPKKICSPSVSICSFGTISCIQGPSGHEGSQPRTQSEATSVTSEAPAPGILAAKDSLEIVSSTKLLTKGRTKKKSILHNKRHSIKLDVKKSNAKEEQIKQIQISEACNDPCGHYFCNSESSSVDSFMKKSRLQEKHNDSISLIAEADHESVHDKIEDVVTCPTDACIRQRMGPYLSSLPSYMWPTKHDYNEDVGFKEYKPCTQSQIDKLLAHHAPKQHLQLEEEVEEDEPVSTLSSLLKEGPMRESPSTVISQSGGVTTCECDLDRRSSVQVKICGGMSGKKYKEMLNEIPEVKLWSNDVEMKRMHVLGSEDRNLKLAMGKEEFLAKRVSSIKKILADYPSMCSLFHGASKCV